MNNTIYTHNELNDFTYFNELANTYLRKLFPINRSILNSGVKESLEILKEIVDFDILEVSTGYDCFDWKVPEQWEVSEAYIEVDGKRIIDFRTNNLHVLNYSEAIDRIVSFEELKQHLHYIPELPKAIPYKTSYYKKEWGFCISYQQFKKLQTDKEYKVKIDSHFIDGNLLIGEKLLKGKSKEEILISAYTCHPSMANDSLSGVIMWMLLLKILSKEKLYYSYRFVLVPETIGAITYLHLNKDAIKENVKRGFVLTTCGGPGKLGYKRSFKGDDIIDLATKAAFNELKQNYIEYPFDVNGSDERQYSSPYFRIPCATISKDKYYEYSQYHTSLDNLNFVKSDYLIQSLEVYLTAIQNLELSHYKFKSLNPAGEPFFTKRNLYSSYGITINNSTEYNTKHLDSTYTVTGELNITGNEIDIMLWFLFWADGEHTLVDISCKTNKNISELYKAAQKLVQLQLLEIV